MEGWQCFVGPCGEVRAAGQALSGGGQQGPSATCCRPDQGAAKAQRPRRAPCPISGGRISTWGSVFQNGKITKSMKNLLCFFRDCT